MKYKCPKCGEDFSSAVFGYFIPDDAVVSRFNELVNEGKVEFRAGEMDCWKSTGWIYRLRPTPRYRPFNTSDTFKLDEFDGMIICNRHDPNKTDKVRALYCGGFALMSGRDITWDEAVNDWLTDTGEPFGVKEE